MKSIPGQALASFSPSIPLGADSKNWNHSRETGHKWLWSSFMESKPKKLKIRVSRTKSKTTVINICRNLFRVQQKSRPRLNRFPGQVHYSRAVNAQHQAFFFFLLFFCITKSGGDLHHSRNQTCSIRIMRGEKVPKMYGKCAKARVKLRPTVKEVKHVDS